VTAPRSIGEPNAGRAVDVGPTIGSTSVTVDGFIIEAELGRGATGVVHRARTIAGDATVAIKVAHANTDAANAALAHESIVLRRLASRDLAGVPRLLGHAQATVTDHSGASRRPALVLAPVGAVNLLNLLTHVGGELPTVAPARTGGRSVFVELVGVIADLHAAGVVHADLSPANVVLHEDGGVMLVDFECAVLDGRPTSERVAGTPPFVAPEVLSGETPRPAADVFSAAMIMISSLSPMAAAAHRVDARSLLIHGGCPERLATLLLHGIDPDPARRPPSAAAFRAALIDIGPVLATASAPQRHAAEDVVTRDLGVRPLRSRPAGSSPHRHLSRVLAITGAIVGVVMIAIGVGGLLGNGADDPTAAISRSTELPIDPLLACGTPPTPPRTSGTSGTSGTVEPIAHAVIDASGCPVAIAWQSDRAEATVVDPTSTRRFRLGTSGDELLVGDWDGDKRASPALYRPATGELFEFDGWAARGQAQVSVRSRRTGVLDGVAVVRPRDGHDTIEVRPSSGPSRGSLLPQ